MMLRPVARRIIFLFLKPQGTDRPFGLFGARLALPEAAAIVFASRRRGRFAGRLGRAAGDGNGELRVN